MEGRVADRSVRQQPPQPQQQLQQYVNQKAVNHRLCKTKRIWRMRRVLIRNDGPFVFVFSSEEGGFLDSLYASYVLYSSGMRGS
mmetsp:Transcript_4214/g.4903  ORF Transcript_4214/g.4903 Transcript_4214/m.4903 type:complete len:84 (+) Transcript_4214:35-286(+)